MAYSVGNNTTNGYDQRALLGPCPKVAHVRSQAENHCSRGFEASLLFTSGPARAIARFLTCTTPGFPSRSYRPNNPAGSIPCTSFLFVVISYCLHSACVHAPIILHCHQCILRRHPSSRWNEKNPAVCIPTASHNVSNSHLFGFLCACFILMILALHH